MTDDQFVRYATFAMANLRKIFKFHLIHPKLCRNCAFPQNFHTRILGEITKFLVTYRTK